MAQPTPYERQFAFSGQPKATWAEGLENELNAVKVTSDETLNNLELIQRDDGALRNGIVTKDSLAPDLALAGLVALDFADEATSIAGEADNVAMAPLGVKQQIDARLASQPEAEAGTNNTKTMTPLRSTQSILQRISTPEDYASLQAAIDADRNVEGRPGASYTHTGVTLSNSDSFDGKNAVVNAGVGTSIYTLSDYAPVLERLYIADNTASTQYAIKASAARYPQIRYVMSPNTGAGGIELKPSSGFVALADFQALTFEGLTGTGISIGSSVAEIRASHIYIAGKLDYDGGGLGRPKAGTVGWRQNTPVVSGLAVGGHQITAANMISVETGYWLTDCQLSNYQGIIADSTRGYGIVIDGASDKITFCNTFVGASMGIRVAGTSLNIKFDGLETRSIGSIPPWGQNPFYNSAGPYYAVTVEDTAKVTINGDNWTGDKSVSVASGASLTVTGGHWFKGRNSANIAAGATAYLAEKEYAAQADAVMRAPFTGHLFFGVANITVAPGVGESITFTAQVNGADTALSFSITGTGTFINQMYGPIFVTKGQTVTLKTVKSAGANANGRYNFDVQLLAE